LRHYINLILISTMKVRYLNMSLSRRSYITESESISHVLVEHAIKLLLFRSPENKVQWIVSICKGLRCDTSKFTSMRHKPISTHLASITDIGNQIDLKVLDTQINLIKSDPSYSTLPRRNLSNLVFKSALNDLVYGLDDTKVYTQDEIITYVNNWYSEECQLYNLN